MKKLQIAANGHPFTNQDLTHLQDALIDMGVAVGTLCSDAQGTPNPIILSGFKFTGGTGGAPFTIGSGWVFHNNEIFYFGGTTPNFNPPDFLRVSSTYAANNPYLGKYIHNIRTLVPIYGSSIAGDIPYFGLQDATTNILRKNFGKWQPILSNASSNYPRFASGIASASGTTCEYRYNLDGTYEFRGTAVVNGSGAITVWTLLPILLFGNIDELINVTTQQFGVMSSVYGGAFDARPFQAAPGALGITGLYISMPSGYVPANTDSFQINAVKFSGLY
jgi:hypothetical protein